MKTNVIHIGNSAGIIIPKVMLESMGLSPYSEVELKLNETNIEIKPIETMKKGWEAAAEACHRENDDKLIVPDVFEDEGMEDIVW